MSYNVCNNNILAIIYNNYGPYHLQRLAYTSKFAEIHGVTVLGIELASREILHPWKTDKFSYDAIKYTVFPEKHIEEVKAWPLARGTWSILNRLNPQALAVGPSRESLAAWLTALIWTRFKKRTAVLLMDSKYDDAPRRFIKEWLKKHVISHFDAALVAGTYSRKYAEILGIQPERIFVGCDVVDNEYFSGQAKAARESAASIRLRCGLPDNYFLYVGRFDAKKNISRLLQAYAQYLKMAASGQGWHLVLCGSGPLEDRLRQESRALGLSQVMFAGFKQIDELPLYYGLARCLIIPSLGDTWSLVINEAMACGLPVLVSRACGCSPDLVQEGVNGFTFDPYDVNGLAQLIGRISSETCDILEMGEASRRIIASWPLALFAENLLRSINAGNIPR